MSDLVLAVVPFEDDGVVEVAVTAIRETGAHERLLSSLDGKFGGSVAHRSGPVAVELGGMVVFGTQESGDLPGAPGALWYRLYATDGTAAGTVPLIPPGVLDDPIEGLLVSGERAFFLGFTNETGYELWVTDGTAAGTGMVTEIVPGISDGVGENIDGFGTGMAALAGGVVFQGPTIGFADELWFSDGTEAGAHQISSLPGGFRVPTGIGSTGERAYFVHDRNGRGSQLWETDGTEAGTRSLTQLRPEGIVPEDQTTPLFAPLGDGFVFTADDGTPGTELWFTDGTAAGTRLVADLPAESVPDIVEFVPAGEQVFFVYPSFSGLGFGYGVTDGTAAGTRAIDLDPDPDQVRPDVQRDVNRLDLAPLGDGALMFGTTIPGDRNTLGYTLGDGTAAGTAVLDEPVPAPPTYGTVPMTGSTDAAYAWFAPSREPADLYRFAPEGEATVIFESALQGPGRNELLIMVDTPFLSIPEAQTVALLYEAGLNRDGAIAKSGLNFWIDRREDGLSELGLADRFLRSPEFEAAFGDPYDTADPRYLDDRALVEQLFFNVLDRPGAEGGIGFWVNRLADPAFDRPALLLAFAQSPENVAGSPLVETLTEIAPGDWDFVA